MNPENRRMIAKAAVVTKYFGRGKRYMNEKLEFAKKIGRNLCAFVLALGAIVSSIPGLETSVKAADDNYDGTLVLLEKRTDGGRLVTTEETSTTMIAGQSNYLETKSTMKTGVKLDAHDPFAITIGAAGGDTTIDGNDYFTWGANFPNYTLNIRSEKFREYFDSSGEDSLTFAVRPNLTTTNVTSGEGFASWAVPERTDSTVDPPVTKPAHTAQSPLKVTLHSELPLIEDAGFKLTVTENQPSGGAPRVNYSDPTGYFKKRYPADGETKALLTQMGDSPRKWMLQLRRTGQLPMDFDLECTANIAAEDLLTTGGTITLDFFRLKTNTVNLTVMSPDAALRKEAAHLRSWGNDPHPEDQKLSYFTLDQAVPEKNTTEFLTMKGNYISVLSSVWRYNGQLRITWKPEQMTGEGKDTDTYTQFLSALRPMEPGATRLNINEPDIDVIGYLVATFYYDDTGGSIGGDTDDGSYVARIPIKILGAGAPPTVKLTNKNMVEYVSDGADPPHYTVRKTPGAVIPEADQSKRQWKMDVYDGSVDPEIFIPDPPVLESNQYKGFINFGTSRGTASKLEIVQSGSGKIRFDYKNGTQVSEGDSLEILNEDTEGGSNAFTVTALQKGTVSLKFKFYGDNGQVKPNSPEYTFLISDHTPNDNSKLSALDLTMYPDTSMTELLEIYKEIYSPPRDSQDYAALNNFGFSPNTENYGKIELPYIVKEVTFRPQYEYDENRNPTPLLFTIDGREVQVDNKSMTEKIALQPGRLVEVSVIATAQNGSKRQYTLSLERQTQSAVAELKRISVLRKDSEQYYADYQDIVSGIYDGFKAPEDGKEIPYSQDSVDIVVEPTNAWSTKVDIYRSDERTTTSFLGRLAQAITRKVKKNIPINCVYNEETGSYDNVTEVKIDVTSEDGSLTRTYTLNITRMPPSHDSTIKEPQVSYWAGSDRRDQAIGLDGYMAGDREIFTQEVSYSTNKVKLLITPTDYRAQKVIVTYGSEKKDPEVETDPEDPTKARPLEFIFDTPDKTQSTMEFKVEVVAEDGKINQTYTILIPRKDPNRDTTATITLTNLLTNAEIDFGYTDVIDDYSVKEVEYTPGDMRVLVQVTPKESTTIVTVNETAPRPGGVTVPLTQGSTTTIKIQLTAEDGSQRNITIPLKYNGPSKNAYLSNLTAGGFKFLPAPTMFDKDKTSYKIEIPKGTASFPVTPTLLKDGSKKDSSNATITINDAPVKDGEAYTFTPSDKTGKITVVVTAQDGKSKKTYTINYKNWNLMVPSDENTLKDLKVDYGDLQPTFTPGTQEYEVYVKPDAMSLKLFPKLKDPDGQIRVVAGKVLTEFEDAYSVTLMDDELDIQIYVWSEKDIVDAGINSTATTTATAPSGEAAGTGTNTDMSLNKANAREYVLHVYRNDEEKIGNLKPITAEMVDFVTADPIVIDITKYPIISADVFNTLKTDYVDKSILFKGNDYTLQVFGEDIDGLVPHTETFDLRFSFFTPDQNKIEDLLEDIGSNGRIEPVYYYFNQHGALPAEMLLTVNLGRHYRNQYLYWNYYNPERERIDYYGYVRTNATGTFSVPISHFSTYLSTDDKIRGAENKSQEYGNPELSPQQENLNAPSSVKKSIPNTGAGVGR